MGFACVLALGGCGGVQFEGKVFDYMGISGDRTEADVHMTERPPLLLPPNLQNLPQPGAPGSNVAAATARPDWPDDPERVKKRAAATEKAKQAEVEAKAEPLNAYAGKPTLLDKWLGRSKPTQEAVADVPEPDPSSDRVPESQAAAARPQPVTPHVPHTPVQEGTPEPTTPSTYSDPFARRDLY